MRELVFDSEGEELRLERESRFDIAIAEFGDSCAGNESEETLND